MAYKQLNKALNEKKSFLHRMNPALKVMITLFFIVLIFLPTGLITQSIILFTIISLWIVSKLPYKNVRAVLRTVAVIFVITFLINWLVNKNPYFRFDIQNRYHLLGWDFEKLFNMGWIKNSNVILDFKPHYWFAGPIWGGEVAQVLTTGAAPKIGSYISVVVNNKTIYLVYNAPWYSLSAHTMIQTISISLKIFMVLSIISIEVNTTSTLGLSYGIGTILKPLKVIKVPVTQIATVIAIALKFVPNLLKEANHIIDAQASRGCDMRNGHLFTKIRVIGSLIVPMFSIAFNKADILADSMESRNFDPTKKRSRYRRYPVLAYDWVFMSILILLIILFSVMVHFKAIISPAFLVDIHLV